MPIPPDHVLYGPVARSSYQVAKGVLIQRVREAYTPPMAATNPRVLAAYWACKRKAAKLFLSTDLVLDEDPSPFHLDFTGSVHLGPDNTQQIAIAVPCTLVTAQILAMEHMDRTAIANMLIGREYAMCTTTLLAENLLELPEDMRPDIQRMAALLAELYEHVLAGTAWRTSEPHAE